MPDLPVWEQRFRAPTRTFPVWSPAMPERFVLRSDESGSFQAYAWEHGAEPRRLTDERVGITLATVSGDGSSLVWFSDPTGDESGRWLAVPFEGGEPRELLPGAPVGWPEGPPSAVSSSLPCSPTGTVSRFMCRRTAARPRRSTGTRT